MSKHSDIYYDRRNVKFDEFFKLKFMLQSAKIPFDDCSSWAPVMGPNMQLRFPCKGAGELSDVIFHVHSYGYKEGLLEMAGLTGTDDVKGNMTAEEVFAVWSKEWERHEKIHLPDRDELYKLICELHDSFTEYAKENRECNNDPNLEYLEGKAFAYDNAAYIIEERMRNLYIRNTKKEEDNT